MAMMLAVDSFSLVANPVTGLGSEKRKPILESFNYKRLPFLPLLRPASSLLGNPTRQVCYAPRTNTWMEFQGRRRGSLSFAHGLSNSERGCIRVYSSNARKAQISTRVDLEGSSLELSMNSGPSGEFVVQQRSVPKSIYDISNGDHILGFGANLTEDHPGFHDADYKARRTYIANLAKLHNIGEPIPEINYSEEETRIWGEVLSTLSKLYPTHACKVYLDSFPKFGFQVDQVPQLQQLSEILYQHTGWRIRPVAGLLHPRDFINGLAFKYFHSTQYIRHGSFPMYTPEPDICHEILGHIPMLADPSFCELAQSIGVASLGASDKEMWHLTKLYWYTVEFGTIMEEGEIKAFGAGLLSSFGELNYMKQGKDGVMPTFVELDPFSKLPKISYKEGFQKTYFYCSSFEAMADKIKAYSKSIHSKDDPFHMKAL